MQEVAPHREGGEVRHEGGLLGPGVVVVRLIGIRRTDIGGHPPAIPLSVPQDIGLEGLEDQVLHRDPAPRSLLTVLELLSQVLLEGSCEVDLMVVAYIPLHFSLDCEVLGLLEGGLYLVGEGAEGRLVRTPMFEALDELIEVRHLARIVDTTTLVVEAREEGGGDARRMVACHRRHADRVIARIVEDVFCRAVVATLGVHTMQTKAPALVAHL